MLKIAIPTTPSITPYIEKAISVLKSEGFNVVLATESEVEDLLHRNYVDLAFTTPLGYGRGVTVVDYRIIPSFALAVHGYTNIAGISFLPQIEQLESSSSSTPNDFIYAVGKHLIEERYDCKLSTINEPKADVQINWVQDSNSVPTLDIGEEWEELYNEMLPLGFWVCRPEMIPENISEILSRIYSKDEAPIEIVEQLSDTAQHFAREGTIIHTFDEKFVSGLEKALEMLYYGQWVPEIPAVKYFDGPIIPLQQ